MRKYSRTTESDLSASQKKSIAKRPKKEKKKKKKKNTTAQGRKGWKGAKGSPSVKADKGAKCSDPRHLQISERGDRNPLTGYYGFQIGCL